jgi:hypothetical protein
MTRRCARCGIDREVNESRDVGLCRDCTLVERDLAAMPCPLGLGSVWGHKAHLKLREPACDACTEATRSSQEQYRRRRGVPAMQRAKCGTPSGRSGHAKRKEPTCDECKAAQAAYNRESRQRKRQEQAA